MAWKLYTDAACTTEFSGTLSLIHRTDLSDNPQDSTLYYAEVDEDTGDNGIYKLEAESNPGTDNITLTPTDASVGSGHEATEITLALTSGALATNTAGASLSLGTQLTSGVTNATAIYIRVENAVTTVSNSTELTVDRNAVIQSLI